MAYMATERLRIILLHVGFHHFISLTNGVGALSSWKDYNNSPYETGSDTFGRFIQAADFSRLFFLLQCCFSSWVSASLQLGNRPPPSTGWLGTWSWKFLPLLLIFSSGTSLRINLQYQPSGGEWCIPHTPRIYALVWLPLNPEWLPILPWRVFTHRWIWFCCFSGVELQRALDWREKPHVQWKCS